MFTRRILCAHDLTYASEPALALALQLARRLRLPLTVVHATEPPFTRATMLGSDTFSVDELELLTGIARRGEAFVTGLKDKNRLRLKWQGQQCELDVELPPGKADDIARVGPYVCSGVKR